MQQLTNPTQNVVHHNEESSHLLSTVWLKEGNIVKLEMALFPINKYTGEVEYRDPVFIYSVHDDAGDIPDDARRIIQSLSHDIMLRAFRTSKARTIEQRGNDMLDAYRQARGIPR